MGETSSNFQEKYTKSKDIFFTYFREGDGWVQMQLMRLMKVVVETIYEKQYFKTHSYMQNQKNI